MNPMILKGQKYNPHYGGVRGDLLRPPHGTTSDAVKQDNRSERRHFGRMTRCKTQRGISRGALLDAKKAGQLHS